MVFVGLPINAYSSLVTEDGACKANHDYQPYPPGADSGYNGASPTVNYTHVYSSGHANLRDVFSQKYNNFFGISFNYTQTHDIKGIKMINYKTPDGAMYEKEALIFKNGTEVMIPSQNIGNDVIASSAILLQLCS